MRLSFFRSSGGVSLSAVPYGNSVIYKKGHIYDKSKVCLKVILTSIEKFSPYGTAERRPPVESEEIAKEIQILSDFLR